MSINASITVHADQPGATIQPEVYGHFAEHLGRCIYEGIWVGEDSSIPNTRGIRNDVVAALRNLKVPVLRWPGGCFADEYHWKDGIGPRENRPSMINTHWGGVVENNHFGTHEFLDLCEQIGTAPYICGNVGSGSPQEMMEWVEYLTSNAETPMTRLRRENGRDTPWDVRYFGIGNESWGCGGNMRPEFYADNYRRFNTFVKNHSGNKMYRIACGSNVDDYRWTEVLMENAGRQMNGLSLHYYTLPTGVWNAKGSATAFDEEAWHTTLRRTLFMDELIQKHGAIMDRFDPEKKVGMIIDEWGTWYDVEPGTNPGFLYQQNTLRDALVAALNFHIFHKYADRVTMTNIAQTINVLQTMILTDNEKMVLTPTYHVFEMFKGHQGGAYLPVTLETPDYALGDQSIPAVSASASRSADGRTVLSLAGSDPNQPTVITITGLSGGAVSGRVLTAETMQAHNTFDSPEVIQPAAFTDFTRDGETLTVTLPPMSVAVLELAA
ncbi:MAG: alpha-N-arabinofuranosidase [Armatimonadota bacterium]